MTRGFHKYYSGKDGINCGAGPTAFLFTDRVVYLITNEQSDFQKEA